MPGLLPEFQQIRQTRQRTPVLEKLMRQQFSRARATLDVDAEADAQERFELAAEFLGRFEARRAVCGDEVEGFKRFFVQVGGFGLDHLNGHDAERPDVDFRAVFFLLDHFGRHPVGGANHGGALALGFGELSAETEVGCDEVVRLVVR